MDDLDAVSEANRQQRTREAQKVEVIIQEEVARFLTWWDSLAVAPTIAELRLQAEDIRQREMARTLRRLRDLSPEDRERIDALSRSLVRKLLHAPITALRGEKDLIRTQAARELFGLDNHEPS
jgi:glutamyl-tRNA reductase